MAAKPTVKAGQSLDEIKAQVAAATKLLQDQQKALELLLTSQSEIEQQELAKNRPKFELERSNITTRLRELDTMLGDRTTLYTGNTDVDSFVENLSTEQRRILIDKYDWIIPKSLRELEPLIIEITERCQAFDKSDKAVALPLVTFESKLVKDGKLQNSSRGGIPRKVYDELLKRKVIDFTTKPGKTPQAQTIIENVVVSA